MAATSEVASLTITQSLVGGPKANGSSDGTVGGMEWAFRGMMPGSTTEAWTKDEKQM